MFLKGGSGRGYLRLLPLLGSMVSHSLSEALPLPVGKMLRQLMVEDRGFNCSGVGGAVSNCPSRDGLGVCAGFSAFALSPYKSVIPLVSICIFVLVQSAIHLLSEKKGQSTIRHTPGCMDPLQLGTN